MENAGETDECNVDEAWSVNFCDLWSVNFFKTVT